jgi:glutaconate CoA-transferase subunit B
MSAIDTTTPATTGEIQTIVAARRLTTAKVVFIGVGKPSTAAILARSIHNPELVLVYESGTIGAKPHRVPLSIGDGELAETADAVVAVPEMFNYWVGPGRIDVAFLGAAQVDRYGNLNSTVIGDYAAPRTRLPGAGGAPEIAGGCGEVVVVAPHSTRTFVDRLDFVTTVGHADPRGELGWAAAGRGGDGAREAGGAGSTGGDTPVPVTRKSLGFRGRGPSAVITDLGVLEPDPETKELTLVQLHPGATVEGAQEATGWDLRVAADVATTDPPTAEELHGLRELVSR